MRTRVPVITQVTATECGICCVSSVLATHGRHESMTELRADLEVGRDGSTVGQLANLLRSRGMQVRLFEAASPAPLALFDIPVIIFWEGYHFVVLERVTRTGAILMDPAMGRRRITTAELEAGFSGVIVLAAPGDGFVRKRRILLAEWRSFPLIPPGAGQALLYSLVLAVLGYLVTATMPFAVSWTVDSITQPDAEQRLWAMLAAAPAGVVLYFALQAVRTFVLSRTLALVGGHLMETVFGHLLRLPYTFFSTRQVGELLYRMGSVTSVRDLLSTRIVSGVLDIGIAGVMMGYVFWVSPLLGAVTAGVFGLCLVLLVMTQRPMTEVMDTEIAHLSQSQAIEYDAVSSIAAIKMGGYRDEFFARWKVTYDASLRAMRRRMHLQDGLVGGVLGAVQVFGPLALVAVGMLLTLDGTVSVGSAVAVQGVGALLLGLSSAIFASWSEFVQACRLMRRVLDITETAPEASGHRTDELELPAIDVERVSFSYSGSGERVVKDVTLHVAPGEKIAIVGASGSGKSSLALVMSALHSPTGGRVRVGGTDVSDWNLDRLRQQIGYVPQDVRLHDASIVDNLRLGTNLSKEETVERCLHLPFLDFIAELPMAFETMITEQGANFSGGQRQRMAIARALLRNPRIVVFDEATSALDTVTERIVTEHLARLGCTQIILAHRLTTIRACDRIHVLADGEIVESGTHDDLISAGGAFAALYRADHVNDPDHADHTQEGPHA